MASRVLSISLNWLGKSDQFKKSRSIRLIIRRGTLLVFEQITKLHDFLLIISLPVSGMDKIIVHGYTVYCIIDSVLFTI